MSNKTYTTTSSDSSFYEAGYQVFLKRTDFRNKMLLAFSELVPQIVGSKGQLNVLDIGCGNGEMTKCYLDIIRVKFPTLKIQVCLIEPSKDSLENAHSIMSPLVVRVINKNAEEAVKELVRDEFDLIIGSYVFYHINPSIISGLLNLLSSNGCFAIMMGASKNPLREHPALQKISKHGSSDVLASSLDLASKAGFRVLKSQVKTNLKLDGLWNHLNGFTYDGRMFFSFQYNVDIDQFNDDEYSALNEMCSKIFSSSEAVVHPVHELYLLSKESM